MSEMSNVIETNVNLVINRLNRAQYDELCASSELQPFELYLVDDENFDVFNKKIVNVAEPFNDGDGVNLGYLQSTYIKKNEVYNYVDNTNIVSNNGKHILSSDGCFYERFLYDEDWIPNVISGDYLNSQVTVYYHGYKGYSGTNFGWAFKISTDISVIDVYTNDVNDEALIIDGKDLELGIEIQAERKPRWEMYDRLIRASDLVSELSSINLSSTVEDISQSILNLYLKFKSYN